MEHGRALLTPAPKDVGDDCIDVGTLRACFTEQGIVSVPQPMPSAATARGFRCWGSGYARKCEDRAFQSDAFSCTKEACTQRIPRLPDDGEWECADFDGVVVCHGGGRPAGVIPGAPDVGWLCGDRRGQEGERVCVDFAPDRPGPEPWACRFHYEPGHARRSCTAGGRGALGFACDAGCPFGSECVSGHCLPQKPKPECWLDRDCGEGSKCSFASCRKTP